jgi:hypothetical protein
VEEFICYLIVKILNNNYTTHSNLLYYNDFLLFLGSRPTVILRYLIQRQKISEKQSLLVFYALDKWLLSPLYAQNCLYITLLIEGNTDA